MKRAYILLLVVTYSLGLIGATSWFWLRQNRNNQTGFTCFDSAIFCRPAEYMAADGIVYAHLRRGEEEAMIERIREYYTADYRKTLPKKFEAELASAVTPEEKQKYADALASLKKWIDVDASFSAPRTYKDLDGVVALVTGASAFVPGVGYVESRANVFFFRRDDTSYRLAAVTLVGEDARTYESAPVDMFKRGVGIVE